MGFLRRYSRLLPFQRCICFIRGLSSWQRAALAWTRWYLVSQRRPQRGCGWFAGFPQRHFSGQLCLSGGCSSCQFSAVTVKTASVSYFIQIYSSCAFIRLSSIAVLVRKWSFFPASQDFFPGACFCRSFSVGAVTQSEMLILFGAELELVLSPCPGCCRRFWTGSPWPGKHLRETTGGFALHAFNQVATFWEDKHPPTPHGSSLRRDKVGWCGGPYMQPKACVTLIPRRHNPLPHQVESIYLAGAGGRRGGAGPWLTICRLLALPQLFTNPSLFFYGNSKKHQFSGRWLIKYSGASHTLCTERAISLSHAQCYQYNQMFLAYLAVNIVDLDFQYWDG